MSPDARRAAHALHRRYRSYVINYNLGKDLVARVSWSGKPAATRAAVAGVRGADLVAALAVGLED